MRNKVSENGQFIHLNFNSLLNKGVFSLLKDQTLFARAFVAFDTVCWPNDLDFAPETLYVQSVPISMTAHENNE